MRPYGRNRDELGPLTITPDWLKDPEGSALIRAGDTWVICTASVEERVPPFLKDSGKGWVTGEYAMLPRATNTRGGRRPNRRANEVERRIRPAPPGTRGIAHPAPRSHPHHCRVLPTARRPRPA